MAQPFFKGDDVQIWSVGRQAWIDGNVEEFYHTDCTIPNLTPGAAPYIVKAGTVKIKYASSDSTKWVPPEQIATTIRKARAGHPIGVVAGSEGSCPKWDYQVGDQIEVWSLSQKQWCAGSISKEPAVKYIGPDGQGLWKAIDAADLRLPRLPVKPGAWVQVHGLPSNRFKDKIGLAKDFVSAGNQWRVQFGEEIQVFQSKYLKVFSNGKLELTLRCSDGHNFVIVASKVEDILSAVAKLCKVHQSCVWLTYRGRRFDMYPNLPVVKVRGGMETGSIVYATILCESFPEQIGPFETAVVPIAGKVFSFYSEGDENGGTWTMRGRYAQALGLSVPEDELLCSQTSPIFHITLGPAEKDGAKIPRAATHFVWSYQMPNMSHGDAREPFVTTFFNLGGYMYLNEKKEIVQINTLLPAEVGAGGGLQFEKPRFWEHQWTDSLQRTGRFHEITIPKWREIGATHYCWLAPGEKLYDHRKRLLPTQPIVTHGAFAYLFHEDSASTERGNLNDRYFAVVSGDAYKRADMEICRSVSSLSVTSKDENRRKSLLDQEYSDTSYNPLLTPFATGGPVEEPDWWIKGKNGLVQLGGLDLQMVQDLFNHTHKTTDNWTRDRGCSIHGVNNEHCTIKCMWSHKEAVPSRYKVLEVWRNQNLELWRPYTQHRAVISAACKQLELKSGPPPESTILSCGSRCKEFCRSEALGPHEWWLFHGSGAEACRGICKDNFQDSMCGNGQTWKAPGAKWGCPLYGFGHYFAERITKADEYARPDRNGDCYVLLCRVCGGRPHVVLSDTIDPDELHREVIDGSKHSVIGDRVAKLGKPYREFVLYESTQIFPEFLIKYKREHKRE